MLEVRCPRCTHFMKYQPKEGPIQLKVKRCVYCGTTFKIHSSMETSRIHKLIEG